MVQVIGSVAWSVLLKHLKMEFNYIADSFADVQVLRYRVPGFEELPLRQKLLIYHLSEAALMGRDMMFDQNCRYNLAVRATIETIVLNYKGEKGDDFCALETYLKRVWFANGIHHHYNETKFVPEFSESFFRECVAQLPDGLLPLPEDWTKKMLADKLAQVIFGKDYLPRRTVQNGDGDLLQASANNYYGDDVTQREAEDFYAAMKNPNDTEPISYGLNSRLEKRDGRLVENVWKVGGLYSPAIERIVAELEQAKQYADTDAQKNIIVLLTDFYRSGDLRTFNRYAVTWVQDTASEVDFINGFTETYGDPLGMKASWESNVNFINKLATYRTEIISSKAQWFEEHSPIDDRFRKKVVKGVSAKVITIAMLGGDCYPSSPIGINLPNADWIRRDYGSKSVTLENITEAYDKASTGSRFLDEFAWSDLERDRVRKYGFITDNLHTDLHECLGHGSGQLLPGTDPDSLKAYGSTLEEARADLFGLYFLADDKLIELGLLPDKEAFKAEYYHFMMNGLMTQLVRIKAGDNIEEAHMRNRQLIARWVYEHGKEQKVVELRCRDGKTFVVVNDYEALRKLFGQLLTEVQRIKSEGDYKAGRDLVENYGVRFDTKLHAEVLERYASLNLYPFKGFINPVYQLVKDVDGKVTDIAVSYTEGYAEQMLRYSHNYSYLNCFDL